MKNTKILALLLIVVFAFSLTLGVTAAQNDPTIAVELKSSTATQVIVNVVIKNNPGFDFCRTDVYYNADVLKFESYDLTGSIVPTSKVWNPNATKDKDGVPFINCSSTKRSIAVLALYRIFDFLVSFNCLPSLSAKNSLKSVV